ncbi:F1F0 ATP synthase subunit delta [Sugiyamaella lignohabitans]|uniref:ATP synthase subunit delta, mitochondrial n=1 Tax=Sugiyamaella lignohabitans TaxID=796027 RepID=A0A167FYE5_9ASCO|nr:F1F0 ATP synthase subunit delta [Sugiyamaella lignohabitans]ANB15861.1 F1F0 ATP synthase subunit delta [Sugiyamaella lignohabitans]
MRHNCLTVISVQVNIPTTAGDIGVLAGHVPIIQQLRPGVVEVIEGSGASKQFFVAGGFATVSEGSSLAINAVEAFPIEDFSAEVSVINIGERMDEFGMNLG